MVRREEQHFPQQCGSAKRLGSKLKLTLKLKGLYSHCKLDV